ncbi:hypothetical protein [Citrobacter sedlakii]|uniref:hypothetical protein n=1 Tax=Citrobacter sedlakii TaxID=67826 RepID=UPI0005AA79EE|nr:hypothetical protein [Citrobacter sedlakii]
MKQKKRIFAVLALSLLVILSIWLWIKHSEQLAMTCQGGLVFKDRRADNPFTFEGVVVIHFTPDGTGYFSLNGDIMNKQNHWTVSRQQNFSWKHIHDAFYQLQINQVERFGHDDVPAGVFEKYALGTTQNQKRLLNIQRTPDEAVVISNYYSPLLVCAG